MGSVCDEKKNKKIKNLGRSRRMEEILRSLGMITILKRKGDKISNEHQRDEEMRQDRETGTRFAEPSVVVNGV